MKKYLFNMLTMAFLLPFSVFAQEKMIQKFNLDFSVNGKSFQKTLSVSCSDGQCELFLNTDSIGTVWAYVSTPNQMISSLSAMGLYNVFLIQSHAGDGCPTVYQLLKFTNEGKAVLGEPFGNCNSFEEIEIKENEIEIEFPGTKEPKRKRMIFNESF